MTRVPNLTIASVPKIILLLVLILVALRCQDAPNFPDEPFIEFLGLSKDTLIQGNFQEDSLFVFFRFEDGDGDLGRTDQDPENNIFFIDERTGTLDNTFGLPAIPDEGASNGVEGEIRILLFSTCCLFPDGSDPCTPNQQFPLDTVRYRIYIKDNANHISNEILTTPITLRCN